MSAKAKAKAKPDLVDRSDVRAAIQTGMMRSLSTSTLVSLVRRGIVERFVEHRRGGREKVVYYELTDAGEDLREQLITAAVAQRDAERAALGTIEVPVWALLGVLQRTTGEAADAIRAALRAAAEREQK